MTRQWVMGAILAAAVLGLASGAAAVPATLAYDEAGNYEAGAFTNGANRGAGFGAWQLSNWPAELGDSTAGGGGDVNSTNGVSFRFMGDGTNGWCNGRRDFAVALRTGDVARFVFAYNWNGGGRGVDLFCATGQFANLIHVMEGDTFQVNGQTASTAWAPQAVVAVEKILQETNGIRVSVVRTANGVENLNVVTNILHAEPVTGLGFYCGGYACVEAENPNYALFVNDLRIAGDLPEAPPEFGANPGPLAATTGVALAFAVTATGVSTPVLALESTTASGGYAFAPGTGQLDYVPPLADGDATQVFTFTASNEFGVATQAVEVAVVIPPPAPPEFGANPGPLSATTGVAMAFTVTAAGEPAPTLELATATASGGYAFAPETGQLDYLPPWADGGTTQAFVFAASNDVGLAVQTVAVAVAWGEPPQVIAAAGTAASNQFRLEWPADTGRLYRVETTADLVEEPWSNATPQGLVFSNAAGACELPMDGLRRYYRFAVGGDYMVIDLSEGPAATNWPVSYLSAVPAGGWTDEYKTTKLVMRRIPAGSFTMGSPTNELGRYSDEPQHSVTLTKDFYIGVFEVTQKQWERVMGTWPSYFNNAAYRESRPVEGVSYNEIRGTVANWPVDGNVDTNSFMGLLRAKTGQALDLPTEAQWEYACRAGTTNALNSGFDLTNTAADVHMDAVGRYWYNGGSGYDANGDVSVGSAKAGSYLPNAWGLYDMHGNVWEWCLDWYESAPAGALDPPGPASGTGRVLRGGGWYGDARSCRSAYRTNRNPTSRVNGGGFRVVLPPGRQ